MSFKFQIERIVVAILLLALVSGLFNCKAKQKQITNIPKKYSRSQEYLFNLLDNYTSEYFYATRQDQKENIQSIYKGKLEHFLMDSLGGAIDSINVTVDTVIQKGWLVSTQFHTRDIEFKYGMGFKDKMEPRIDSVYKWMRSLKPKTDLTVNFITLGDGELNFPDDNSRRTIRIFAWPEPLWLKRE